MADCPDEAVPRTGATSASPPDLNVLEFTAQAADAIFGPATVKKAGGQSARITALFGRLLGYGPHAALVVALFGFALVAGSYLSDGQLPFYAIGSRADESVLPQESVERSEILRSVQEMAEQIRILKANVEAMRAAPRLSLKDGPAAIAALAGKLEHVQSESAARLLQAGERLDRIEQQIAALRAVAVAAPALAPTRKQTRGDRHDAFDPSQNPTAPGAPRPLGSLAPAASTNPTAENASGQRTY